MKCISWNVNGIRAALKKGFLDTVSTLDADILCLQETRALPEQVELSLPGYKAFWNPAQRKGYSGTAVFTRIEPVNATCDFGVPEHDTEGRVITVEFDDHYLVNVYTPNSGQRLERHEYRTQDWDPAFLAHLKNLETVKPVIFTGDLNVAHRQIDLAQPDANVHNAGFTIEERRNFNRIIDAGFIDSFREFTVDGGHYTWWSYFGNARAKNLGWRIDYVCISPTLRSRLKSSTILPDIKGSDHCPVAMTLE